MFGCCGIEDGFEGEALFVVCGDYVLEFGEGYFLGGEAAPVELEGVRSVR